MENDYLTMQQVADYLRVHKGTIRKWIRQGKIKAVNSVRGRSVLISKTELERFIA